MSFNLIKLIKCYSFAQHISSCEQFFITSSINKNKISGFIISYSIQSRINKKFFIHADDADAQSVLDVHWQHVYKFVLCRYQRVPEAVEQHVNLHHDSRDA